MSVYLRFRSACALLAVLAASQSIGCASMSQKLKALPLVGKRPSAPAPETMAHAAEFTRANARMPSGGVTQAQYVAPVKAVSHAGCKTGGG